MSTIIVALDLQENTGIVVQKAVDVARKFEAELHLVHVIPLSAGYMMPQTSDPLGVIEPAIYSNELELLEVQKNAAREYMDKLVQTMQVKPADIKIFIGDIEDEIVNYAKEAGAEMIIIGTHQRRGLDRLLTGETSVRILHEAKIPILVVPTDIKE